MWDLSRCRDAAGLMVEAEVETVEPEFEIYLPWSTSSSSWKCKEAMLDSVVGCLCSESVAAHPYVPALLRPRHAEAYAFTVLGIVWSRVARGSGQQKQWQRQQPLSDHRKGQVGRGFQIWPPEEIWRPNIFCSPTSSSSSSSLSLPVSSARPWRQWSRRQRPAP